MADVQAETIKPDPSATSIANDEALNAKLSDNAAGLLTSTKPTDVEVGADEVQDAVKNTNPEADSSGESKDVSVKTNGHEIVEGSRGTTASAGSLARQEDTANGAGKYSSNSSKSKVETVKHSDHSSRSKSYSKESKSLRRDFSQNVKSDLTSQAESSDPVEIRKQKVEFYFSDSNLPMDKFLFSRVEGHKNLPVPIEIIHSFKRMRHFQPFSAVIEALKESSFLDLVEDGTCVKRKVPLDREVNDKPIHEVQKVYEDRAMASSVYVKGFGEESPSTQFDIEAFFAAFGQTKSVRLRRSAEKYFKGSVFVQFDSPETQQAFLALDPKPRWKGKDLIIKSKKQYCDEKCDDIAAGKIEPNRGEGLGRDDDRDWRVRRDEDRNRGYRGGRGQRGHKGYGSKGRGGARGGARGGRGGRDRNEERRQRDEHEVPKIATPDTTKAQDTALDSNDGSTTKNGSIGGDETAVASNEPTAQVKEEQPLSSKKRGREDDGADVQVPAKKIDAKEESL
ncbi:hypothetical protein MMC20_001606 [Loxospora ochrophaea]|nr:hypothetical protein [Loxospora ochrophaea]